MCLLHKITFYVLSSLCLELGEFQPHFNVNVIVIHQNILSTFKKCLKDVCVCWEGFFEFLVSGFSLFGLRLLEGRVLHKGTWFATLLGYPPWCPGL